MNCNIFIIPSKYLTITAYFIALVIHWVYLLKLFVFSIWSNFNTIKVVVHDLCDISLDSCCWFRSLGVIASRFETPSAGPCSREIAHYISVWNVIWNMVWIHPHWSLTCNLEWWFFFFVISGIRHWLDSAVGSQDYYIILNAN